MSMSLCSEFTCILHFTINSDIGTITVHFLHFSSLVMVLFLFQRLSIGESNKSTTLRQFFPFFLVRANGNSTEVCIVFCRHRLV